MSIPPESSGYVNPRTRVIILDSRPGLPYNRCERAMVRVTCVILTLREERMRIAYFVTPHGFGHAARAAAVMVALQEIDPTIQFDIFTQVPHWFFQDSLVRDVHYYNVCTDIGVVQT